MKKLLSSFIMLVSLITLGSCVVQSSTTIKFVNLPEAVYVSGETTEEQFMSSVTVQIDDALPCSLQQAEGLGAIVTGVELNNPGQYTLVVTYNSFSVTFKYEVVQKAKEVDSLETLEAYLADEKVSIIELVGDIDTTHELVIKRSVTIIGNNHKITLLKNNGGHNRIFRIKEANDCTIAFYDLNIINKSEAGGDRGVHTQDSKNLTILFDNCGIEAGHYAIQLGANSDQVNLTIKNGSKFKAWAVVYCWASNSTINVYDSTLLGIKSTGGLDFAAFAVDSEHASQGKNNTFNIENCIINTEVVDDSSDDVYIISCMGKYSNSSQSQYLKEEYKQCVATGNTFNFKNCNLTPHDSDKYWLLGAVEQDSTIINIINE